MAGTTRFLRQVCSEMLIAILGTRGIPASYSGFETCVEETAKRFAASGHQIRVYCRKGRVGPTAEQHASAKQVFVPFIPGKHTETISHTFFSVLHLIVRRADGVQLYGAGNGWFVPMLRLFGFRVVFLTDGLDWERAKWGRLARWLLRNGSRVGARFAQVCIVDSREVLHKLSASFEAGKFQYVPYGANITEAATANVLHELGLARRDYYLFVGRFVPEKNVELLIQAFNQARLTRNLVLVGGNQYDRAYELHLRNMANPRVVFPGFVFGERYLELVSHCYAYVQPSVLEGTSPAILGAI